jgi:hypothetical protein
VLLRVLSVAIGMRSVIMGATGQASFSSSRGAGRSWLPLLLAGGLLAAAAAVRRGRKPRQERPATAGWSSAGQLQAEAEAEAWCREAWLAAERHDRAGCNAALAWLREREVPCLKGVGDRALELAQRADEWLRAGQLEPAVAAFRAVQCLSPEDPAVLAKLISALQWAEGAVPGGLALAAELAAAAVAAGVWADPAQRPAEFVPGLPSAPWPDPGAHAAVRRAIAALEAAWATEGPALAAEARAVTDKAAEAAEGLQLPSGVVSVPIIKYRII